MDLALERHAERQRRHGAEQSALNANSPTEHNVDKVPVRSDS